MSTPTPLYDECAPYIETVSQFVIAAVSQLPNPTLAHLGVILEMTTISTVENAVGERYPGHAATFFLTLAAGFIQHVNQNHPETVSDAAVALLKAATDKLYIDKEPEADAALTPMEEAIKALQKLNKIGYEFKYNEYGEIVITDEPKLFIQELDKFLSVNRDFAMEFGTQANSLSEWMPSEICW